MEYAADVVIMGRIIQNAEEVFTSLVELTSKMRFEINDIKDKIYDSITEALEWMWIYRYNLFLDLVHHITCIILPSTLLPDDGRNM